MRRMILPCLLAIVLGWGVATNGSEQPSGATANQFQITRNGSTNKIVFLKARPNAIQTAPITRPTPAPSATPIVVDDPTAVATAKSFLAQNKSLLVITNVDQELAKGRTQRDQFGMTHVTFHQKYNGIWVFGGELKVHLGADGLVSSVSNKFVDGISLNTTPAITSEAAKAAALDKWNADGMMRNEAIIDEPVLLIYPKSMINNDRLGQVYLAWQVRIYAKTGQRDPNCQSCGGHISIDIDYYVDAASGNVLGEISNIKQLYRKVYDCNAVPGSSTCWSNYVDTLYPDYVFGRVEGAPPRGPNPRPNPPSMFGGSTDVDELYDMLANIQDYWWDVFARNGANTQGGLGFAGGSSPNCGNWVERTCGMVHADEVPGWVCPMATWSDAARTVNFCLNVKEADVVGHEYAHGVLFYEFWDGTGNPIGALYLNETGALEESHSDLSGEFLERDVNGVHDWINGGNPPRPWERNLTKPELTIASTTGLPHPNRFYDPNYACVTTPDQSNDFGYVHANSTVPSHACYLMAMGGSFNGCDIPPIGEPALQQILYRTWTVYATSTESFNEFYAHMIQSCHDLYDATHPEYVVSVTRALQATEMDQPGACSGIPAVAPACRTYVCGDANGDLAVNISDAVYLIAYIFAGGSAPEPLLAGDANCDTTVNISDAVYLIAYIFAGGAAPCAACK